MGEQQTAAKRVEYLLQPDEESSAVMEFKKACSILIGDLYGLAELGKYDPRGSADFKGKLMTLYQLIRGDMIDSDIKIVIEDDEDLDENGLPRKVEYYKYKEMAVIIDGEFRKGFDMDTAQLILEKMNEFIRESGILKRNIPRALLG